MASYEQYYDQQQPDQQPSGYDQWTGLLGQSNQWRQQADQPIQQPQQQPVVFQNKSPADLQIESNASPMQRISMSLSQMLKENGGEIFAKTMASSADGIMKYLMARKEEQSRMDRLNREAELKTQARNAEVARSSSMPTLTSVVKPSVSGTQKVGNQRTVPGLIGNVRQRSI